MKSNNPLCKYCDKEMYIKDTDYYGTDYLCDCADFLKEETLTKEISDLDQLVKQKQQELFELKDKCNFNKQRRRMEEKLQELISNYNDGKNYTSRFK